MTKIESDKKEVGYNAEKIFSFITNFQNFEALLPADKVENFKYTEDSCSFRIKGMTDLGLKIEEKNEYDLIKMKSDGKVPFPFGMDIHIATLSDASSEVHIEFQGEISPFMKVMVEKPLRNFFNMLVERLAELKLD